MGLLGGTGVIDDGLVVLITAMGEIHSDHVHPSIAELVDSLDGVRLGPDGADDRGPSIRLSWGVRGVEVSEPFDSAPHGEMIEGVGCHGGRCATWSLWWRSLCSLVSFYATTDARELGRRGQELQDSYPRFRKVEKRSSSRNGAAMM